MNRLDEYNYFAFSAAMDSKCDRIISRIQDVGRSERSLISNFARSEVSKNLDLLLDRENIRQRIHEEGDKTIKEYNLKVRDIFSGHLKNVMNDEGFNQTLRECNKEAIEFSAKISEELKDNLDILKGVNRRISSNTEDIATLKKEFNTVKNELEIVKKDNFRWKLVSSIYALSSTAYLLFDVFGR